MSRYIGNYLRVPSSEPQQASAPGIWSINEQLAYQRANVWPPARDPYYNQTVLHLSGDVAATRETNPVTQPRTFLSDASTNNFLLTPNGDVSARPFSPYASSYSNYFDGTGDYLSVAANSAFDFASGNFTIEAWINKLSSTYSILFDFQYWYSYNLRINSNNAILSASYTPAGSENWNITSANNIIIPNIWNHVALVRNGSSIRIYVNGNSVASGTFAGSISNTVSSLRITHNDSGVEGTGYISNLRIVKGTAVYTTNFTPPTTPLENIAGTSLLTCQANRFKDNSSNNFTVTRAGDVAVAQNSPFVEYDTTSGSGYFDGSGDYLETGTVSSFNFLHSPSALFTVQCWVYIPSVISSGSRTIIATTPNSGGVGTTWTLEYYNSAVYMNLFIARGVGGVWVISGYSTSAFTTYNQWTHLAVTYDQSLASNNATFYINGQPVGTASKLANAPSSSNASYPLHIGRVPTTSIDFNGYIADLHISNSILPITVPTAPLTAVPNTSLLTLKTRAPANNQGILDTSPNSFVVTRTGNVAQGSFSPFSASGYSVSTTATNTLDLPGSVLAFGSSSFTVEAWVYATHTSGAPIVYPYNSGNAVTSGGFSVSFGTGGVGYYAVNGATPINYSATIPINTWYHLALVKDGTAARLYLNGQLVATGTDSTTYTTPTGGARVGGIYNLTQTYGLVVNNLRIVTGQALYNANFTPATTNLTASVIGHQGLENTAITGTVRILTARDAYRIDRSPNNHTIGSSGSPQFLPISPFAPTQAYVASQLGGSGYFDGTGDYLTVPTNTAFDLGSGAFTLEAWVYRTASGSVNIFHGSSAGLILYIDSSNKAVVRLFGVADLLTSADAIAINTWTHIAVARSGTTLSMWLNGSRSSGGTVTNSSNFGQTGLIIGTNDISTGLYSGYISSVRLVKGTAVYDPAQTTIAAPTAPPTAIPGTSLLLNFTNGGIVDATGKNNLETVGNSGVQTSQAKWSSGSMYFNGASHLLGNTPANWTFLHDGSSWTIEFWIYPTSVTTEQIIFATNGTATAYIGLGIVLNTSGLIGLAFSRGVSGSNAPFVSTSGLTANQWNYVGITFTGSTKTCAFFINGTPAGSSSNTGFAYSSSAPTNPPYIGQTGYPGAPIYLTGYIDDFRITRGIARTITASPTGPFPLA